MTGTAPAGRSRGVLLVNLGTPDDATPEAVGRYLREFLMDPLVIDIPAPLRWFLVNVLIVPKRKHASAELYRNIWTADGSPLLTNTRALRDALAEGVESFPIEIAMRYGNPSIAQGLERLKHLNDILVVPLYPQYAESSYLSTQKKAEEVAKKLGVRVSFVPPFYSDDGYLNASAAIAKDFLADWPADHVLFTFHGLPAKHIHKTDLSVERNCLAKESCCDRINDGNRNCYRAQSFYSAREIAKRAGITNWSLGFQSRLGRAEWIRPYTDHIIKDLAQKGIKRLAVVSPSFTADCLETLEEIGFRERDSFLSTGGSELRLVPSLNADPRWVTALKILMRS